jgi:hypothetical protein
MVQVLLNSPPLSPKAMLERLPDVAPATLYRQLQLLTDAGMTRVAAERAVRGVVEKSYALGSAALAPPSEELLRAGPQDQFRYFTTFLSTLMNQYGADLAQGNFDLVRDGVGFRQAAIHATDAEYQAFLGGLSSLIVEAMSRPPEGRRRRLVTSILMPAVEPESTQGLDGTPLAS